MSNDPFGYSIYENSDKSFVVFETSESSKCNITLGFSGGNKPGTIMAEQFGKEAFCEYLHLNGLQKLSV